LVFFQHEFLPLGRVLWLSIFATLVTVAPINKVLTDLKQVTLGVNTEVCNDQVNRASVATEGRRQTRAVPAFAAHKLLNNTFEVITVLIDLAMDKN
jgi:hypothetical protein